MQIPGHRSVSGLRFTIFAALLLAACQFGRAVPTAMPSITSAVPSTASAPSADIEPLPGTSPARTIQGDLAIVRLEGAIPKDRFPFGLAFSRGKLWVLLRTLTFGPDGSVIGIDPVTHQISGAPVQLDFDPWSLAATDDWLWVAKNGPQVVAQVDARTHQVTATVEVDASLVGAEDQGAWVASSGYTADHVLHIDPATHRIVGDPIPVGLEPIQLVTGAGTVWVGSHSEEVVTRIDPEKGETVATIEVGFPVHGLAAGPEAVWVADYHGSKVVRISPITNQIDGEPLSLPFPPYAMAVSATDAWVGVSALGNEADPSDDRVVRIDLATNTIVGTLHLGGRPIAMVSDAGSLWVATVEPSQILQIVP